MIQGTDTIEYRRDIDGLRALAILAVVAFHFFPSSLSGGFVGVDIFFVISGYLISSIIFTDLKKDSFSFIDFYVKRIRRIFPSLLIILLFTMIAGWLLLYPSEFNALGNHLHYASMFLINYALYKEAGYFAVISDYKPLLHIWSLSVEEQFYIFFPICIFIIFKFRRYMLHAIILGILVSFLLNVIYVLRLAPAAFYSLPTRAWEMLAGSLLAYYVIFGQSKSLAAISISIKTKNALSILAIAMITYALFAFDNKTEFPSWRAILPVLATSILICTRDTWFNKKILSHQLAVWIGLISYPLYLWHWPLISFPRIIKGSEIDTVLRILLLMAAFILAYLTTLHVERPIRKHGNKVACLLLALMAIVMGLSISIKKNLIATKNADLNPMIAKIDIAIQDWKYGSQYFDPQEKGGLPFNRFGRGENITVFFGDSNVEQYWPRIQKLMQDKQSLYDANTVVFATYGGLAPIPGSNRTYRHKDEQVFLTNALEYIRDPSVSTIVFGANWQGYFNTDTDNAKRLAEDFEQLMSELKHLGKRVYLILNIPIALEQDPKSLIKRHIFKPWNIATVNSFPSNIWLSDNTKSIMNTLKQIAKRNNAIVIDPSEYLCKNEVCSILDANSRPIYKDSAHLNASYVRDNAKFLDQILASPDELQIQ
jgi:peptidoglycan/LPS O-acetylase OafA/YrhL